MRHLSWIGGLLLLIHTSVWTQQATWIFFRDKGPMIRERLEAADAEALGLTREALLRRAITRGDNDLPSSTNDFVHALKKAKGNSEPLIDEQDLPVYKPYIEFVKETGAIIRAESKWMNAISIRATREQLNRIASLSFVTRLEPVRRWKAQPLPETTDGLSLQKGAVCDGGLDYGASAEQLEMINVPKVHAVWIDGTGSTIGMLDVGYRWRTHEALKGAGVLGEYDFIFKDSVTQNEAVDSYGQDSHGTLTFSVVGGFKQGTLIGSAFGAAYFLAKTEFLPTETQVEEDYYAQGLEWLESQGATVTSSSLGYSTWDDGTGYSYANGDFDGQTAVTTRAAARAAKLGVVVVTAMGNEGNFAGTLIAPSDADSILSIGAIDYANQVASFSSNGPTNDGRNKPDVVAPGVRVFAATKTDDTSYTRANGTSMATPLAAGVAALVRSARPELTPVQVREAIRETADRKNQPNNSHGWGKIDAWAALLYHGMVISTNPKIFWDGQRNSVAVYVLSPSPIDPASVRFIYTTGSGAEQTIGMNLVNPYPGLGNGSGLYTAVLPSLPRSDIVRFYIAAGDSRETRTSPFRPEETRHQFFVGETRNLGAENVFPPSLSLEQNYPNPVTTTTQETIIRYSIPDDAMVNISLYDMSGRRVTEIVNERRSCGSHEARFSGLLASGAYVYVLTANKQFLTRGMIVVR